MPQVDLRKIESFGHVAAEDDPVLRYFVATDATKRIEAGTVFLVLGRKGSGKTALVRYFSEGALQAESKALNLKGYPWKVHATRRDLGASEIEAYVASWRYIIALQFALLAFERRGRKIDDETARLAEFLKQNYGSLDPKSGDILRPSVLKLSKTSIEPQVLGNKIGSISFERTASDPNFGAEVHALADKLIEISRSLCDSSGFKRLFLQIDELDQGLSQLDVDRKQMLTGLVIAARDLFVSNKKQCVALLPVVYLRTDIWEAIHFSDKNKISQTASLTLDWNSTTLLDLVERRITKLIGPAARWEDVVTKGNMRGSQPKWEHICARTFLRPRDVISFLNFALVAMKARPDSGGILDSVDITEARSGYSGYLKSEIDDEVLAHWTNWEEALQSCSAISTITFTRNLFNHEYELRRSQNNQLTAERALKFLYEYSIIGYEKRSGYGGQSWIFRYKNPEAGWDNAADRFKVHIGLKEYAKLREERTSNERSAGDEIE